MNVARWSLASIALAKEGRTYGWCVCGACGVRGVSLGLLTGWLCTLHAGSRLHRKQVAGGGAVVGADGRLWCDGASS